MTCNRFWAAASKILAAVAVTIIVVLTLAPGAWAASKYKVLYQFPGGSGGDAPDGPLVFDAAGNLYGTTYRGGDLNFCDGYGCGTVFELMPNADGSWTEKVLHAFVGGADGSNPMTGVVMDKAGRLYGTTPYDGASKYGGTVFQLTPNPDGSWEHRVLFSFSGSDGSLPFAGLILDTAGNLYGTTMGGGTSDQGTVFELTPNAGGDWTEKVLYSFKGGSDGRNPGHGSLVPDAVGNLYGTTESGGAFGYGVAFRLMPKLNGSWKEQVLHHFKNHPAARPEGGLVFDSTGTLYGTTREGGTQDAGTVFRLAPSTGGGWTYRVLYVFKGGEDGATPLAAVVVDAQGNLYGTTYEGGQGVGVVYMLTPRSSGTWRKSTLYTFSGAGCQSSTPMIPDAQGNLYGAAPYCGGSVFEITP